LAELPRIISKLIGIFEKNYHTSGNVWGVELRTPQISEQEPSSESKILIISTKEIAIRAIKEIIFEFLVRRNAEFLDADILVSNELKELIRSNIDERLGRYVDIIKGLSRLAKSRSGIDFVFIDYSLAPELLHFSSDTHRSLIQPVLEKISALPNRELLVYDPLEYLTLKTYEKQIGKQVFHILEKVSIDGKRSLGNYIVKEPCIVTRRFNTNLRKYLDSMFTDLVFHPLSGNLVPCCGEFMWITSPKIALNNAKEILKMLSHYSRKILTLCPSANFIFSVAQRFYEELRDIEIKDLIGAVAT